MKQLVPIALLMIIVSCSSNLSNEPIKPTDSNNSTFISINEARTELLKISSEIEKANTRSTPQSKRIESEYTIKNSSQTRGDDDLISKDVYVYNFEKDGGFAIMSSDKKLPSLLVYAETGKLIPNDTIDNPGLIMFLSNLDTYIKDRSIEDKPVIIQPDFERIEYGEWETVVYQPGGLCKVKWGQDSLYNNYCPKKNNKHCQTGCVAVAAAQLMAVHSYPSSYNGYNFPWNEMTKYKKAYLCSETGIDGIARLMQQLGLKNNLNMNYGLYEEGGSGAESERIFLALENFGYSNPGIFQDFNSKNVIFDLMNGYPVVASGKSFKTKKYFLGIYVCTTYSGGHAWLLHGLIERKRVINYYNSIGKLTYSYIESVWYPQCNWGWDGYQDGYYLMNAFDSNKGPAYGDSYTNTDESQSTDSSGEQFNYQYLLKSHTGIRK